MVKLELGELHTEFGNSSGKFRNQVDFRRARYEPAILEFGFPKLYLTRPDCMPKI